MTSNGDEDELMRALAVRAKAKRAKEPDVRWDARAAGTLDAEELAELERLAGSNETARALKDAFEPIGDEERAAFAHSALDALRKRSTKRPKHRRRTLGQRIGFVAALTVAAMALLLVRPSRPELPEYRIVVSGGARTMRDPTSSGSGEFFRTEDRLEIIAQPSTAAEGDVRGAIFVQTEHGFAPLDMQTRVAPTGAIRFIGLAGDVLPEPGRFTLRIVVASGSSSTASEGAWHHDVIVVRRD